MVSVVFAVRYAVPTAAILAACAAVAGLRIAAHAPRDPCEATPEIHACAMFLQPDWMIRQAQAGRLTPSSPALVRVEGRKNHHAGPHADPQPDAESDMSTGSIVVTDRVLTDPTLVLPASETGPATGL